MTSERKAAPKPLPLRIKANRYAAMQWVPTNPTEGEINWLMYYAYMAGYRAHKKEVRKPLAKDPS